MKSWLRGQGKTYDVVSLLAGFRTVVLEVLLDVGRFAGQMGLDRGGGLVDIACHGTRLAQALPIVC